MINLIDLSGLSKFVKRFDKEISGLASVIVLNPNLLLIDKYWMLNNISKPSFTEISSEALHKFFLEKIKKNEDVSNIRCWWHTHGRMSAFFSSWDLNTIEEFPDGTDWLLSVVFGNHNSVEVRLDMFKPLRVEVPVRVVGRFLEKEYNVTDRVTALDVPWWKEGSLFKAIDGKGGD